VYGIDEFRHVTLTVSSSDDVRGYLDGELEFAGTTSIQQIDNANNPSLLMHFFVDDTVSGFVNDWAKGQVALIRVWDGVLTDGEVSELAADPFGAAVPRGGDYNDDGQVDVSDVDLLSSAIRSASLNLRFDINGSGGADLGDLAQMIHEVFGTWFGDANLDGLFDTSDLVTTFQAGQYEDAATRNSTWSTGDWNADGDFTSSDLVKAFQDGGYEHGPRPSAAAVPEPSGLAVLLSGAIGWIALWRAERELACGWLRGLSSRLSQAFGRRP
jgi:hypothetical protein